eukprot:9016164-Karenia_brevis.AAC.1
MQSLFEIWGAGVVVRATAEIRKTFGELRTFTLRLISFNTAIAAMKKVFLGAVSVKATSDQLQRGHAINEKSLLGVTGVDPMPDQLDR